MVSVSLGTAIGTFVVFFVQAVAVYLVWGTAIDSDFVDNLVQPGANYYFYYHMWLAIVTAFVICIGCFASIPTLSYTARTNFHSLVVSARRQITSFCGDANGGGNDAADADDIDYQPIPHPDQDQDIDPEATVFDLNILEFDEEETTLSRWIGGTILMVTAAILALVADDLTDVISISGATYCTYVSNIWPAVICLLAMKEHTADVSYVSNTEDIAFKYIAYFSILFGIIVFFAGVITVFL